MRLVLLLLFLFGTFSPAQDPVPLVTGRLITPLGEQVEVGSFPANMALTPDKRYVVVTNTGFRQYLTVLSADDGHIVSQLRVNAAQGEPKIGLYYGLAMREEGDATRIYASRGSEQRVAVYHLDPAGKLTDTGLTLEAPSAVPNGKAPVEIAGLALSSDGTRLYAVNNHTGAFTHMKGSLLVLDTADTTRHMGRAGPGAGGQPGQGESAVIRKVELPGFPFAIAGLPSDQPPPPPLGGQAGPLPVGSLYVSSERDGVVSVVDGDSGRLIRNIPTGDHPVAVLPDPAGQRVYIANAGSDTVSVIDIGTERVVRTIPLRPADMRGLPGATPTGLALSPVGRRLYVTLADLNAVAVIDLAAEGRKTDDDRRTESGSVLRPPSPVLLGYIPAGWYPTSVVASPDGKRLFVANAKGVQSRNPNGKDVRGWGQYIQNILEGTVSVITLPSDADLPSLTAQVVANAAGERGRRREGEAPESGPEHRSASDPSPLTSHLSPLIQHVLYIIKENRTYDQVLGDLPQGNGDPSLCMFPRTVTPNQHALAERFALLDNFYDCAEVSADGWDWSTSGMISEYTGRNAPYYYSGRGRKYDFEGDNNDMPVDLLAIPDVARAPGGYIWDQVARKGLSYRNYGFYLSFAGPADRGPEGRPLKINNTPNKRVLVGHTDLDFLQFDMTYPDSDALQKYGFTFPKQRKSYGSHNAPSRFSEWKREFDGYVQSGNMPRFTMIRLPRDHTAGTSEGLSSPRAMVADNDYGVGQIVEAVSNSPFWKSTAVFVLEDDAQDGHDHVDAHRSICFVISPYVRRGSVDHRFYNTDSTLRTMELLLGVPPMCQYDAYAAPIDVFGDTPDNAEPYHAILPDRQVVTEVNRKTAYRAADSARLDFTRADAAPENALNDILWHATMGNRPQPRPVHSFAR